MPVIIRFTLFLLLGLTLSGPALADTLPLSSVLEKMPGKSLADVKAQAQTESGAGPTWGNSPDPSALPFHQTFTGTVTADATMTKLAIFSDDGCDVTVDGAKVWSAKDQGQALPDLANSLHELSVTLSPGDHTVQIDYSNTVYTPADPAKGIPPDIDGCSLFVYGVPDPNVTVTVGDLRGVEVGVPMTSKATASVDHLPGGYQASDLTAHWSYSTTYIEYSATGADDTWDDATDGTTAAVTLNGADSDPSGTFNGTFMTDGYYEVSIKATVTYHVNATGQDLGPYFGYAFVGSDDPSAEASSATLAPAAVLNQPHGLTPHGASGATPTPTSEAKVRALGKFSLKFVAGAMAYKTVDPYSPTYDPLKNPNQPYPRIGLITMKDKGVQEKIALKADLGRAIRPSDRFKWVGLASGPTPNSDTIGITAGAEGTSTEFVANSGRARSVRITVKDVPAPNQDDWAFNNPIEAPEVSYYASKATNWAQDNDAALGGGNHNGRGDAARHAYWSALITKHLGAYIAYGATTSHERLALEQGQGGVRYNETVMDLENNATGRDETLSGTADADMLSAIKLLLDGGVLTILDDLTNAHEEGLLIPSNVKVK